MADITFSGKRKVDSQLRAACKAYHHKLSTWERFLIQELAKPCDFRPIVEGCPTVDDCRDYLLTHGNLSDTANVRRGIHRRISYLVKNRLLELRRECIRQKRSVNDVVFHPDQTHCLSGSDDGTFKLFNIDSGDLRLNVELSNDPDVASLDYGPAVRVKKVAISPDASRAVAFSSGDDRQLLVWDLERRVQRASLTLPAEDSDNFRALAVTLDGKYIIGRDRLALLIFDVETAEPLYNILAPTLERAHLLALTPDGRHVVYGEGSDMITVSELHPTNASFDMVVDPIQCFVAGALEDIVVSPDG